MRLSRTSRVVCGFVVAAACHLWIGEAGAQTPYQLVPILTSQSVVDGVSNQFGVPVTSVANDAGDFAFIGTRGTGLYYRKAGTLHAVRVIQFGDPIPGVAGARVVQIFAPLAMNSSGRLAVRADIATTNGMNHAVLTFDGTTLQTVVTGLDIAPGTGGLLKYERTMALLGQNTAGDLLIGATMQPAGSASPALPSLFLIPAGGAAVRIAGPGDLSPGTGGTFSAVTGVTLNDAGQILFSATITGGSGATGIFVWKASVVRKVVAAGDANPASGGTFSDNFTTVAKSLNNQGVVMFHAAFSLWQNSELGGTSEAAGPGDSVPTLGGVYIAVTGLVALSASSDAVFSASVAGGSAPSGLFRYRPGSGVELVANVGQAVPNQPGKTFALFFAVSVNASGTVTFQGNEAGAGTGVPLGFFQKAAGGALTEIVAHGASTSLGGFLFAASLATQTLSSGAVVLRVHLRDAPFAHHAQFLWNGSLTPLMTTADLLPPGARLVVRPENPTGVTNVGVLLQLAGGRLSIGSVNPILQTGGLYATEGEIVSGTGGGRLLLVTTSTVLVNLYGDVALQANLLGGGVHSLRAAILAGGFTKPLEPVMISGETADSQGRLLTAPQMTFGNGVRPVTINSFAQVAFTAVADGGSRGVFVGLPGAVPDNVALPGAMVTTGQTIATISPIVFGLAEDSRVHFAATTNTGQGLFIGYPVQNGTPTTVVHTGDAAPGGGTFSGFGAAPMPSVNAFGAVAFVATVSGGPGGGVYLAQFGSSTEAVALNGQAAPGGGTFVITNPWGDAVVNTAGEVAFVADLSGGSSNSGIFYKANASDPLVRVAGQGDPAPGTSDVFGRFVHGPNGYAGEVLQISYLLDVAFSGTVMPAGGSQIAGLWRWEVVNGSVQPIIVAPSTLPAFDGGTAVDRPVTSSWMNNHYLVWTVLANGPHMGGLYLHVPAPPGPVYPTGPAVLTISCDTLTGLCATATFDLVTAEGEVTLVRRLSGPPLPRGAFRAVSPVGFYDLSTTVSFTGSVQVCFPANGLAAPSGAVLRLLHYENSAWVDVTTSWNPGVDICGTTTSLSPFVIAIALNEPTSNIVQNGTFAGGMASWTTFGSRTSSTNQVVSDASYIQHTINNGVFEYYRVAPAPPDLVTAAVVLQNTGAAVSAGDPLVAHFDLGNSSSARKRISVLIHDRFFGDLSVCTFYLAPGAPMRTYAMRTHTTAAWTDASISFYAASAGSNGGAYQLDNVVMGPGNELGVERTDCVDPNEPGVSANPDGAPLVTNGDFANGATGWNTSFAIATQVVGGVMQFARRSSPPNGTGSGVLLQHTQQPVGIGRVVTASFQFGNPTANRHRVTVLLHDFFFGDLAACTFWLPAGLPLSTYSMRSYTTQAWTDATISVYPATNEATGWLELDNVTLGVTPAAPTYGADCVEPGDDSGLSQVPAPAPAPVPAPGPQPAEISLWTGRLIDRRWVLTAH